MIVAGLAVAAGASTLFLGRPESALLRLSLRAVVATQVWQRQSMEWSASVMAAKPTAMPRSMSRRSQTGRVNPSSSDWLRRVLVWWRL